MRRSAVLRAITAAVIIGSFAAGSRVAAQDHPDFSGRWRLISADSQTNPPEVIVVSFKANARTPMIVVDRYYDDRAEREQLPFGSSGTISGLPAGSQQPGASRLMVTWEDATLRIERAGRAPGDAGETRTIERWRVDGDGHLRIEKTVQPAGEPSPALSGAIYGREP